MNTIMQLRKICNHPYMFQHIEVRLTNLILRGVFIQIASKQRKNAAEAHVCGRGHLCPHNLCVEGCI